VRTKVEELPDSKVMLEVEVTEHHVEHAIEHAAGDLAETMRIPGFRKGKKVPLPVIVARVGKEAVAEEAVRGHIEGWFWDAVGKSGIRPVANPDVEWDALPEKGGTFTFRATVPVAPKPIVADWTTLEIGAAEADVPPAMVAEEIEDLRVAAATLAPVSGRPVRAGDVVVIDLVATEPGKEPASHRDYMAELGTGRLADELEAAIPGMSEGESKSVSLELPGAENGSVAVTVKEIKEKVLPDVDDELAKAISEFDTIGELRADIERRLREQLQQQLDTTFRQNALDALVAASTVEGAEPLVARRAAALIQSLARSLEQHGVSGDAYLRATGRSAEELQAGAMAEAQLSIKRELILEAIVAQHDIDVPDSEIEELIRSESGDLGTDPEEALAQMREQGGFERLRADLKLKKALDLVASGVKRIPVELAAARERLWTPEKEKGGTGMKIWTPGSKEKG
jgi:trigger factor